MFVTAFDGVAWLRTQPETRTLWVGGTIDRQTGLELIPALVVALNEDVSWQVLNLEELTGLSAGGDRLIQSLCRLAAAHETPLRVVYPRRDVTVDDGDRVIA